MPTYTYQGLETGEIFELEQRITEAPLTHNPRTGEAVKRLIGAVGIVFKGSGFYKTDSRGAAGAGASSETGAATSPETGSRAGEDMSAFAKREGSGPETQKPESSKNEAQKTATKKADAAPTTAPAPSATPSSGGKGD